MLIFADGFDHYGPNAARLRNGVYAENNGGTLSDENPRTGQYSLKIWAGQNDAGVRRVLPAGDASLVGVAYAFSIGSLPTANFSLGLLQWRTASNAILASIWVTPTGQLVALRGGRFGAVMATSRPCIVTESYQHFEAARGPGGIEIRINGVTELNIADPGVAGATAQIKLGADGWPLTGAVFINMLVDDLVCWSGDGEANNSWFGDVKVYTRMPTADGADQQWIPSIAGPGYEMIDNIPPADQTEYLHTQFEDQPIRSTFGVADFPEEIVAVRGVYLATRAWKTDAGNAKLTTGVLVDGGEATSLEHALSMAPVWYGDAFEVNPSTSAPWDVGALNDLQTVLTRTE